MEHISIKEKIIKHLDGLNELERQEGPEKMIQMLSERYDAPVPVIEGALAEWQAGQVYDHDPGEDMSDDPEEKQAKGE